MLASPSRELESRSRATERTTSLATQGSRIPISHQLLPSAVTLWKTCPRNMARLSAGTTPPTRQSIASQNDARRRCSLNSRVSLPVSTMMGEPILTALPMPLTTAGDGQKAATLAPMDTAHATTIGWLTAPAQTAPNLCALPGPSYALSLQ